MQRFIYRTLVAGSLILFLGLVTASDGWAQETPPGAARDASVSEIEQAKNKAQGPLVNATFQEDDSTFSSTFFTFNDVIIFSYFEDTRITIVNSAGDTVATDTLGQDAYQSYSFQEGVYSIFGSKSYTVLIGDPLSNSVQGYFAVDQSGRGTSTLLNTYMMGQDWGAERFIVFGYEDNTNFEIRDLGTGNILANGTLDKGEHFTMSNTPYNTFLQVSSNKSVSALSYADQDYYVPASNGTFSGTLFYGYSAYIGDWTNSITVTSYHSDNEVLVTNSASGDTLVHDTLGTGQVISHPIKSETYWKVQSSKTVTAANIPYVEWSGSYQYMARAMDESGIGAGTHFYIPAISSNIDVFSYEDNNDVTITRLGEYTQYPYTDSTVVFDQTLDAGDSYNFISQTGNYVYEIESSGQVSTLQSHKGFGADFVPLSFAQRLPDLALNEEGLHFSPPDSELVAGEEATANLTVHNYGPIDANNVTVSMFDGDFTNEGTAPVIASKTVSNVSGNGMVEVSLDFVVPDNPDFETVSFAVDPSDEITESNTSNNTIIRSLLPNKDLLPPLSVSTEMPGGLEIVSDTLNPNPFSVKATIINNGEADAEDVEVELVTFDGLTLAEGDTVRTRTTLSQDTSWVLNWKLQADPDSNGTNRFQMVVDASNAERKVIKRSVNVPDAVAPAPPTELQAVSNDTTEGVVLQWVRPADDDLAGYRVFYGTSSGTYDGTEADQGPSPVEISTFTEYQLTGLQSDTTYYFALKAVDNSKNASEFSSEVSAEGVGTPIPDEKAEGDLPEKIVLESNRPNPFNPTTTIEFAVPKATQVNISVYNMLGKQITTLIDQKVSAGRHQVTLNAGDWSSGVYLYRLHTPGYSTSRKMMLMK